MRIVYVGSPPLFSRGASAINVMKMCYAMSKLGISVELVLPSYDRSMDIFEHYGVKPDFKITTLPALSSSSVRHIGHAALSSLYTRLNRKKFDLVMTRNILYAYLSTSLFKIPTIYDAHHPLVNGAARFLFKLFKDSSNLIRFSTNSNGLAKIYLELGLPDEKLVVAPNGVDLERFQIDMSKEESRRRLGLPADRKIVCYCGNVYSGRGIELLIDAALNLKDTVFLLVGGLESDIENYRKIAAERGAKNFMLSGFVPHTSVPLYLFSSDVLVMPYTSAATIKGGTVASDFTSPIKLFEYMASRRPIVATGIPAVREILENEKNALLIQPDDLGSLTTGINRILEDGEFAGNLALRAFLEVNKYTWEERVKKILNGINL